MEHLVNAAHILIAIPISWMFKLLIFRINIRGRYLWVGITTLLVVLSFLSIIVLYRIDIGKEWHSGIQLSFLLSAVYSYQFIEPLSEPYEKSGSDVNANIEQYKLYLESRKQNKRWWQFWV